MKTPAVLRLLSQKVWDTAGEADDLYCPVIASIEQVGSCHRVVFAKQPAAIGDDDEPRMVAKLILPDEIFNLTA
jgi:hypothetical protein